MTKVAVFMGSASDEDLMKPCAEILAKLGIPYLFTVSSAHRTPERTEKLVSELEAKGCQVFICAAGMAAHLAGAVAARTTKPVLGVPLAASPLGGMDALLATVQMPPGFPVGTLALDKAGARNAAWLAAQILALSDPALAQRLKDERAGFIAAVEKAAAKVEEADAERRAGKPDQSGKEKSGKEKK
jgi:5-(carboxyamino)imidazole ribonucleotide mutase